MTDSKNFISKWIIDLDKKKQLLSETITNFEDLEF